MFLAWLLLLVEKFGLALEGFLVLEDLLLELANGVGGAFGGEEAVEMEIDLSIGFVFHAKYSVSKGVAIEPLVSPMQVDIPAEKSL